MIQQGGIDVGVYVCAVCACMPAHGVCVCVHVEVYMHGLLARYCISYNAVHQDIWLLKYKEAILTLA